MMDGKALEALFLDMAKYCTSKSTEHSIEVLMESLNGPQQHIFFWILLDLTRIITESNKEMEQLNRKIVELEKEITFKDVV